MFHSLRITSISALAGVALGMLGCGSPAEGTTGSQVPDSIASSALDGAAQAPAVTVAELPTSGVLRSGCDYEETCYTVQDCGYEYSCGYDDVCGYEDYCYNDCGYEDYCYDDCGYEEYCYDDCYYDSFWEEYVCDTVCDSNYVCDTVCDSDYVCDYVCDSEYVCDSVYSCDNIYVCDPVQTCSTTVVCDQTADSGSGGDAEQDAAVLKTFKLVTNLSGKAGQALDFVVSVPAGATSLIVLTTSSWVEGGAKGDPDLYARFGALPEFCFESNCNSDYDFASETDQAVDELIWVEDPSAGEWFFTVLGVTDFSGVSIFAEIKDQNGKVIKQ